MNSEKIEDEELDEIRQDGDIIFVDEPIPVDIETIETKANCFKCMIEQYYRKMLN